VFSCSVFRLSPVFQASAYLHESWISALTVMAILTMTIGNIAAIMQDNVKRMLAYSSIAHAVTRSSDLSAREWRKTPADRDAAIGAVAFYMPHLRRDESRRRSRSVTLIGPEKRPPHAI
jgi:NADH:ubiquinone oxidoreductase subunit 5 (subunit L)/multisubunit Na+/H+ antiporter MnhA subunit